MAVYEFRPAVFPLEWKTIPSWPEYEASNKGEIRHKKLLKIKKQNVNSNGYLRVSVEKSGIVRHLLVNRLICETFNGPPPSPHHTAAHEDGNRKNNRPWNLSWKTRKENYQDQIRHGTSKRGDGNHMAKLSKEDVNNIRKTIGPRGICGQLARTYGVSASCISSIRSYRQWRHV